MSSTTTNLGLTKPAYADEADIAVLNGNMDLLDAAYGNINQSTLRTVPFAIAVSDWSAVTGGFSATFNNAYITETSQEILTYDGSLIDYAKAHIIDEKKSGGGGIVFTTATKPTGTITGKAYVFDNDDHTLPVIIEGTVTPIANGGTGQSSLAGAQSALGITALSEQIVTLNSKTPKIEYRTLTYYISETLAANETLNITIPLSPSLPFTPIGAIVQTKDRNIMYVVTYFDLSASSITIRVSAGKNVTDLTTPRQVSVLFIG